MFWGFWGKGFEAERFLGVEGHGAGRGKGLAVVESLILFSGGKSEDGLAVTVAFSAFFALGP